MEQLYRTPSISVSNASMNTTVSSIPREMPNVVTFRYHSATAYVPLPHTYSEAQVLAVQSFPIALMNVDPEWISFSLAIRFKSTGQREEIPISKRDWRYVTSKLVPYRTIDVHVGQPAPSSTSSSHGVRTSSTTYSTLYPATPPQHTRDDATLYGESDAPHSPQYSVANTLYEPRSPAPSGRALPRTSPYRKALPLPEEDAFPEEEDSDAPPPSYPGPPLPPPKKSQVGYGFGYGFGWYNHSPLKQSVTLPQDEPPSESEEGGQSYFETVMSPGTRPREFEDLGNISDEAADRRSIGWSASSVRMASPPRGGMHRRSQTIHHHQYTRPTPAPFLRPQPTQAHSAPTANLGLFSSLRQRILPLSPRWGDARSRRRRRQTDALSIPSYQSDYEDSVTGRHGNGSAATSSGRSYVPSLI